MTSGGRSNKLDTTRSTRPTYNDGWSLRSSQSLFIFILLQHSMMPVASSAAIKPISTTSSVRSYSGQCFPEDTAEGPAFACADNPTYHSHKGLPCSFHAELISASNGENCFHQWLAGVDTGATWLAKTYDQDQIFELIWECPCACNVKCFDNDDDDDDDHSDGDEELTASPTGMPTVQDTELNNDSSVLVDVNEDDQNQHTAESRSEEEDADEMAPIVVTPAVAVDTASSDKLQENDAAIINSDDKPGFYLSDSLEFVAMIAGTIVGLVVMYVSVFSLIQNMRKRKRHGSGGKIDYHTNDRNDLQLASSLSDISESVASVESLNTEDKMRLYKAWRLATKRRGGIEDGFDVVEP